MKRILPYLLILFIFGASAVSGLLSGLVNNLTDLSFRLAPRQASGNIVIVAIDRGSLDRLGPWPWPRRHHASVLDRLQAAGAHRIAFDIDFSRRTNATDDQALADAIGRVSDGRAANGVILPVFRQGSAASTGNLRPVLTSPYAPFTLGARLGTVNVKLEADGRARRYMSGDDRNGSILPSLASLLASDQTPRAGSFFLDYAIQPDSVPRISYIDILNGAFHPEAIKGKTVIIGATATELGDQLAVPLHGLLSGPVVHALAVESLLQGRSIYGKTFVFIVIGAFLLAFSAGRLLSKFTERAEPRQPCRA
jgi:CHASE2 domain-containing sensor protein